MTVTISALYNLELKCGPYAVGDDSEYIFIGFEVIPKSMRNNCVTGKV